MSYIVFARKYRPQTFDDIIGQSHITTTLKNAIAQSRVAHAYLFAGPRGVGKTTTARIFAKALNCEKGPTAKPCNVCSPCKEITQGTSLDILEIDGASNRGIDEIRSLRENIKFAPSKGHFRVYIIDEVHMLTPEAFNALLKTLEEPPAHIKFIFATTSPHKVPATILSRCQRFDFRRIATGEILDSMRKIAKDEKLDVSDEALGLIAKYGDGSMRDGQVILDQISSFSRARVGVEDVTKILGLVGDDILFSLSEAIRARDSSLGLSIINRLVNEGKDLLQVVLGLIEHFRNISVAKVSSDPASLIDAGEDKVERYRAAARSFTVEEILYVVYALSNTIDFMRKSTLSRIPLETAIVRLTQLPIVVPAAELLSRLGELERSSAPAAGPISKVKPNDSLPASASSGSTRLSRAHVPPAQADLPAADKADRSSEPKAAASTATVASPLSPDLEEVAGCWAKVINFIRPKKISIASYLQEGYPDSIQSNVLTVAFPRECQFHKEVLESPDNKKVIEDALREVSGLELRVVLCLVDPVGQKARAGASAETGADDALTGEGDQGSDDSDPIVKAALGIFGGKISDNDSRPRR